MQRAMLVLAILAMLAGVAAANAPPVGEQALVPQTTASGNFDATTTNVFAMTTPVEVDTSPPTAFLMTAPDPAVVGARQHFSAMATRPPDLAVVGGQNDTADDYSAAFQVANAPPNDTMSAAPQATEVYTANAGKMGTSKWAAPINAAQAETMTAPVPNEVARNGPMSTVVCAIALAAYAADIGVTTSQVT